MVDAHVGGADLLQVFDVATDAGANDIVPATDEDDRLEGYKVSHYCIMCACDL